MHSAGESSVIDLKERWKNLDFSKLPIDERDVAILSILAKDPMNSNIETARRIGVTEGTVRRRIRLMERSGLIRGYHAEIDYGMLEDSVKAYVSVRADDERRSRIARQLSQHRRCVAVYEVSGDHDIMAVMLFSSASECDEFAKKHLKSAGVKAATVHAVKRAYKGSMWSYL